MNNYKLFLKNKALENNIVISDEQIEKFDIYMRNLIEWNERINLTAIKKEEEIIVKHFIDSIIVQKNIKGCKILDLGSGAGFPGLPLKIMNDNLDIVLLDAVNKKVNFINDTIEKLNLKDAVALHGRAEDLGHNEQYREKFDAVVSRAVSNMTTLVEYMLPFVKVGGKCICLKGPEIDEELNESKNAIKKLGGKIEEVFEYEIDDNNRSLVVIFKEKSTEQIYPRKQGKPSKEPLK